ncbi:zinc finger MYND domain-containing protein 10 homolog [Anopheles ziemanni]|uniref:zinc finger MYND domain-containing protein 10 homolog n=1 Tax=Anopheles coustani TaxID=139045 RepID=UPI00265B00F3|nr:zinc finger MYND domain-containing protein 10 homolog [Anopheles coustani]XP_058170611.1 zinc finger MYND domain-containing protein 10 homolog [Anopheles ziemanni]
MSSYPCAIFPEEIEPFVQSLRSYDVAEIGSKGWMEQHEVLLKLCQQAYIEASTKQGEVVKEYLILEGKIPLLIHELFSVLVWRTKVLPRLLALEDPESNFQLYSVIYHEVNIGSMLETILYHRSTCEALGGNALDLIDYCAQALGRLMGLLANGYNDREDDPPPEQLLNESMKEEICRMQRGLDFRIGMKCLSIISYLVDGLNQLPLSAATRLVRVHDFPCLIAEILHSKPWLRRSRSGVFEKFRKDSWQPAVGEAVLKVTETEAQTWFCLYKLLFNGEVMRDYEINNYRQREIGKCVGLLNENLLDQLPALIPLKQHLCTLQVTKEAGGNQTMRNDALLLEELPEVHDKLLTNARRIGWDNIVERQRAIFIDVKQEDVREMAKRITAAYNMDLLENYITKEDEEVRVSLKPDEGAVGGKVCGNCGAPAAKKCSKCLLVFYCSRDCQVQNWPEHKELCHQFKLG